MYITIKDIIKGSFVIIADKFPLILDHFLNHYSTEKYLCYIFFLWTLTFLCTWPECIFILFFIFIYLKQFSGTLYQYNIALQKVSI